MMLAAEVAMVAARFSKGYDERRRLDQDGHPHGEYFCVPSDEEMFRQKMREPGGGAVRP